MGRVEVEANGPRGGDGLTLRESLSRSRRPTEVCARLKPPRFFHFADCSRLRLPGVAVL